MTIDLALDEWHFIVEALSIAGPYPSLPDERDRPILLGIQSRIRAALREAALSEKSSTSRNADWEEQLSALEQAVETRCSKRTAYLVEELDKLKERLARLEGLSR